MCQEDFSCISQYILPGRQFSPFSPSVKQSNCGLTVKVEGVQKYFDESDPDDPPIGQNYATDVLGPIRLSISNQRYGVYGVTRIRIRVSHHTERNFALGLLFSCAFLAPRFFFPKAKQPL